MSCRRATAPRGRDRCSVGSRTKKLRRPRDTSPWPSAARRARRRSGLGLAVLGPYGIRAVGELRQLVVAEQNGVHGPQAQEEAEGQVADLTLRVRVGPHLD